MNTHGAYPPPPPGGPPVGWQLPGGPPGPPPKGKGKGGPGEKGKGKGGPGEKGKGKFQQAPTHAWWEAPAAHEVPPAPAAGGGDRGAPLPAPAYRLTSLGWLKYLEHPSFPYFEFQYLKFLHQALTMNWGHLQGGTGPAALRMWWETLQTLELDRKAQVDLLLLAHSGLAGRAEANEILWELLSEWGLKHDYRDLSSKCSNLVNKRRRWIDRPPAEHEDRFWWTWDKHKDPRHEHFSPLKVPRRWQVVMGPGGEPVAPPRCFGNPEWS